MAQVQLAFLIHRAYVMAGNLEHAEQLVHAEPLAHEENLVHVDPLAHVENLVHAVPLVRAESLDEWRSDYVDSWVRWENLIRAKDFVSL